MKTVERTIVKKEPYSEERWFFSHPDAMKPAIILSSLASKLKKKHLAMTECTDSDGQLDMTRCMNLYKHYKGMVISSLSRDVENTDWYMTKMVLRRLANLLVSEV